MLLHTFYIPIPFTPNLDPVFSQIFESGPTSENVTGLRLRAHLWYPLATVRIRLDCPAYEPLRCAIYGTMLFPSVHL